MGMTWLAWKLVTSPSSLICPNFWSGNCWLSFCGAVIKNEAPPPKKKTYVYDIPWKFTWTTSNVQKIILVEGENIYCSPLGFHTFQRALFEAEAVQVKRMTESNMRQQYMEHGLSKLTVPSYGDVGEEAFGKVGRFLVTWSLWDWLGVWDSHQVVVSFWFGEWFNLEQAQIAEVDDKVTKFIEWHHFFPWIGIFDD